MTTWKKLLTFVNSKSIGDTILRQDIIHHIYNGPMPAKYRSSYGSTVDNYRRLLTRLGMLEWSSRGEYKLKHHITNNVSSKDIELLVNNGVSF